MTNAHRYNFAEEGLTVAREVIPSQVVAEMQANWLAIKHNRELRYNPVEVIGPFAEPLASLYKFPKLLDYAELIFGEGGVALYNFRLVVKDERAPGPIFLHQDCGYHVGWPTKMSAFVAITKCGPENGGLRFYPHTHRYGYLGDTGEIKQELVIKNKRMPYCPVLLPGDVVFAHSSLWHDSGPNVDGTDRVYADVILQPSDDPSGKELLRGQWRCEPAAWLRDADNFEWSRTSRLREMTEHVEELKGYAYERELSSRGDK